MPALDTLTLKSLFLNEMHDPVWHGYMDRYTRSLMGEKSPVTGKRLVARPGISAVETDAGIVDTTMDAGLPSEFWKDGTTGADISRRLAHVTQMSHAYYVAPTMQVLVTAASHDWPEDERVREDDFPQSQGWLYIPGGGITVLDIRGRIMATNVILWDCYGGGVDVHYLADKYSPADEHIRKSRPDVWAEMARLSPWHHARVNFGDRVPISLQMGKAVPPEVASQIRISEVENQFIMSLPIGWSPEEMQPHVTTDATIAWLLSCLRIMQQPLASVEKQGVPRNFRKGLERQKVKMKNTIVSVIEYRRRSGEYQSDSGRTLSHRYFRRGHWRRQNYKDEHGDWQQKSIRIQPTIVGDPSLPLMLREHVNALVK